MSAILFNDSIISLKTHIVKHFVGVFFLFSFFFFSSVTMAFVSIRCAIAVPPSQPPFTAVAKIKDKPREAAVNFYGKAATYVA